MNEKRKQSYHELIQSLLNCHNNKEIEILENNTNLIDAGLWQALKIEVENFTQQGEENNAKELRNLSNKLALLTKVLFLLKTEESNGDKQVIYPLLEQNIDKLNGDFPKFLHSWAMSMLAEASVDTKKHIAVVIVSFSDLISEFPLGKKADNIEIAITGYDIVLDIFTINDLPQTWAKTLNNFGDAYIERIKGDRADNLERAIVAFKKALQVHTNKGLLKDPQAWAITQNNLGIGYSNRIKGNRRDNLKKAIVAFKKALQIRTRDEFPQDWAITQSNLGLAYIDAGNLEEAIDIFLSLSEIRSGVELAHSQNNLGKAYLNRIKGDRAGNLEKAIIAFKESLKFYNSAKFNQDIAMTQNNLGSAYLDRIEGNRKYNLKKAGKYYSNALQIYTQNDFPQLHAETLLSLGISYQKLDKVSLAKSKFATAIEIVETLRDEIISGEESKRKQAEQWNQLFVQMVEVCLALGKETEAIEYVERSKNRNLVESIFNRDIKTIFPPEDATKLEKLRDEIASSQYQIQNSKVTDRTNLTQHLQELRLQRNNLQNQYLSVGSSFKFEKFQSTLNENTAIIEWYITFDKIIAFIIKPQGQKITVWESQPRDRKALLDWVNEYLNDYYSHKREWGNQLEDKLKNLAEILHLEEILTNVQHFDRLILIPHRWLHLLPLHALPINNSYLLDLFPKGVSYAPSCQLLQQVQLRQRSDFQSLFAIQTPTEDLYEEDLGAVAAIKKQFANPYVLKKSKATKAQIFSYDQSTKITTSHQELIKANSLFFFCHGYYPCKGDI